MSASVPGTVDRAGLSDEAREFQLSGHIELPATGKEYIIDLSTYFKYEIISVTVAALRAAGAGTLDVEIMKNGVGITGLNFTDPVTSPTTTPVPIDKDATGTVTMAVGDGLSIVADNYGVGAPDDLFFTILCRAVREVA